MKEDKAKSKLSSSDKKPWEPMQLKYIDKIENIVLGGGGKLSIVGGDPGENRKPSGQG